MPKQKILNESLPETHIESAKITEGKRRGPKPKIKQDIDSTIVDSINSETVDISEKKTIKMAKGISELIDRCPKISTSEIKYVFPEATTSLVNEARFWSKVI